MADPYLAISEIATDTYMIERMNAAATQQQYLDNVAINPNDPLAWVSQNRYVWGSAPGWGEAWRYAQTAHEADPDYQPGRDESVITDGMILSAVQALMGAPAAYQAEHEPPPDERENNTADNVADENAGAPSG